MKAIAAAAFLLVPLAALAICEGVPLEIKTVSWYYDGGTLGVAINDSTGCLVEFFFDYGISSENRGRIIVGARQPSSESARLATEDEAAAVIALIRRALDHAYPETVQAEFLKMPRRGSIPSDGYHAWLLLKELRKRGEI